MDFEWRVSFRGRTKGGYAHWSLDGDNWARLNLNKLWDEADYIAYLTAEWSLRNHRAGQARVRNLMPIFEATAFRGGVALTAMHETFHLVLHQVPDVRRFRPRFQEAAVHHWALEIVDEWMAWENLP